MNRMNGRDGGHGRANGRGAAILGLVTLTLALAGGATACGSSAGGATSGGDGGAPGLADEGGSDAGAGGSDAGGPGSGPGADASGGDATSAAGPDGATGGGGDAGKGHPGGDAAPPPTGALPRLVAYVNVACGFGDGPRGGECLASPDPTVNYVEQWETAGTSPITHYILSFLSFASGSTDLQTDPGEIWASGGGSTTDFTLDPGVKAALVAAKAKGKKVFLSIGGQNGSTGFLAWWNALGGSSGVAAMGQKIQQAASRFQQANGFAVDGFDVDIELGGAYAAGSQDYLATRDLINAVPESFLTAFVPQIGNGLCAAPVAGDPLSPSQVLGGECATSSSDSNSAWSLAQLDVDCKRADGTPKLDYWGIQYYNAGQATCCGGGPDTATSIQSIWQNYKNLANGWPASNATTDPNGAWPGPWPAFGGIGADRLVLGKPGCQGCAGSDYLSPSDMQTLLAALDGKLAKPAGGILFWDLGRLFGDMTSNCVSGACQPSWGGSAGGSAAIEQNLTSLRTQLAGLKTK